jgi:hypothetical protein
MSEALKNKLHEFESVPPSTVWDRIAVALNEEVHADFPATLKDIEVTPPLQTWSNIIATLDGENELSNRLYDLEIAPPAAAWNAIAASLENEAQPRIPAIKRSIPIWKYAAAACLLCLLAFGTVRLLSNNKSDGFAGQVNPSSPVSTPVVAPSNSRDSSAQQSISPGETREERSLLAVNDLNTRKRPAASPLTYMTSLVDDASAIVKPAAGIREASLQDDVPGCNTSISQAAERYLLFTNSDGAMMRISKKLAQTLGCLYNNGSSQNSQQCEEQVKKWKDKLAQSSPDNFMGLLDAVKSVDGNKL